MEQDHLPFGKAKTLLRSMPHEENVSETVCFTLLCRKTEGLSYCQDSSFCIVRRLVQNFTRVMWGWCFQIDTQNLGGKNVTIFSVFYMHASFPGQQLPNPYTGPLNLRPAYHIAFPHCFSTLPYHVHFFSYVSTPSMAEGHWVTLSCNSHTNQHVLYVVHYR